MELPDKTIWERAPVLYVWYVTSIQEIYVHTKINIHFSVGSINRLQGGLTNM